MSFHGHDPAKEARCVDAATRAQFTWVAILIPSFVAAWTVGAKASPKIANLNWRIKAVGSSVSVIALSYYKGERALIDCVQEYREREKIKAKREHDLRKAAEARERAVQ